MTENMTMLKWFTSSKKKPMTQAVPAKAKSADGWLLPQSGEMLLDTPLRRQLVSLLWQHTSLSKPLFQALYLIPLQNYAQLVQLLPASESHHHAHLGGMLEHTLEVMCFTAKMRQSYLLPSGAPPEDQAKESEAWTAAVIYGALLHDLGKPLVDLHVVTEAGQIWHPWQGPLTMPYRLRYHHNRDYHLHPAAGALLVTSILPATALDWLSGYPELFASLLYCLSGHYEKAGILGELVQKADQASVAQNLGGNAMKVISHPRSSLPKQIISALRELVKHDFTLNNPQSGSDGWLTDESLWLMSKTTADKIRAWLLQHGITGVPDSNPRLFDEMQAHRLIIPNGDKTIWHCQVTSHSGWTAGNHLTLLRLSPALVWEQLNQRPAQFAGTIIPSLPASPSPLPVPAQNPDAGLGEFTLSLFAANSQPFPEAKAGESNTPGETEQTSIPGALAPTPTSGADYAPGTSPFFEWLKNGLIRQHIKINDVQAKVHLVEGRVFLVSPEIFKLYVKETSGSTDDNQWQQVQKDFQKLKLHYRGDKGINIWNCEVKGPRKTRQIKGYLLSDPTLLFTQVPEDNPYLTLLNTC